MGYRVNKRNAPGRGYEDVLERPVSDILDDHWERYDEMGDTLIGSLGQSIAGFSGLDESYDGNDIDEYADVDEDWEEMLDRHAAAEGYLL